LDMGTADTDAPGLFCIWTDACGNGLEPTELGGTFAVSFLLSVVSGAGATPETEGALAATGGIVAEGITDPGGFGAGGGTPANEAGLTAPGGGGTAATEGAFGMETGTPGAGAAGVATAERGFGAGGGTTPGMDGGFGATGGVTVGPPIGETPGGLGSGGIGGGATEPGCVEIDPGGF
jgi:hypothetical protein